MTGIELNYITNIVIGILSALLLTFAWLALKPYSPPEKYIGESMTSWQRRIDEDYVDFKKARHSCRVITLFLMIITTVVVISKYNIHTVRTEPVKWKAVYENNIGAKTTIDDLWGRSVSPTTELSHDDMESLDDVQIAEITAKNDTDSTTKKVTILKSDIIIKNKASNHKTGRIKAIYYGEGTAKTYWFGKLLNTEVEPRVKIIIDFTPPRTSTERLFDVNN